MAISKLVGIFYETNVSLLLVCYSLIVFTAEHILPSLLAAMKTTSIRHAQTTTHAGFSQSRVYSCQRDASILRCRHNFATEIAAKLTKNVTLHCGLYT